MFKVSFKDNSKKVEKFNDRATIVTLIGRVKMPDWFNTIPSEILDWISMYSGQDVSMDYSRDVMIIIVRGKTVRAEGDADNPILAERIAESRAKIKLYKFMASLTKKLMFYYYKMLYGNYEFANSPQENHEVPPIPCLYTARIKYKTLWAKESLHLGKLLSEA